MLAETVVLTRVSEVRVEAMAPPRVFAVFALRVTELPRILRYDRIERDRQYLKVTVDDRKKKAPATSTRTLIRDVLEECMNGLPHEVPPLFDTVVLKMKILAVLLYKAAPWKKERELSSTQIHKE